MKQIEETEETLQGVAKRFKANYADFDELWKQQIRDNGILLVNEIKRNLNNGSLLYKNHKDFQFRLVVDNNFVFGQIKGVLKKKGSIEECFLYKLLLSQSIQIFAPYKLKEELEAKIQSVLNEDDHELAFEYAGILMARLIINDAQWSDDWKMANRLIGEKDNDDVPYLALAFAVDCHAIVSFDKVFHNQGDFKIWKFDDMDRIITNYHAGILSLVVVNASLNLLAYLFLIFAKVIRDLILDMIKLMKEIIKGTINAISKIPSGLLILLAGLGLAAYLSSEDYKTNGKEMFDKIKDNLKQFLSKLLQAIKSIKEFIINLMHQLKPIASTTVKFLGYLMAQYTDMEKEIASLQNER